MKFGLAIATAVVGRLGVAAVDGLEFVHFWRSRAASDTDFVNCDNPECSVCDQRARSG